MKELRTWTEYLIERFATDKEEAIGFLHAVMEEYQIHGNPAAVIGALDTVVASRGGISELARKTDIDPQVISETLSSTETPRIDALRIILNAFGCQLSIEPLTAVNSSLEDATTPSREPADITYELDERRVSAD